MKKIRYIPYGYTMRNGKTIIDSNEAEIIREIFQAYIAGASLKTIADELSCRNIPYTEKSSTWDRARIARIIDNAKYIGTEEYDPIIDETMYETAVNLKSARNRVAIEKENEAIELLRTHVRCGHCGSPMRRHVSAKNSVRESWRCTNTECGFAVRIRDTQLTGAIVLLMNRIIENDRLLQPQPKQKFGQSEKITEVNNQISKALEEDNPCEDYILDRVKEMASLMYERNNSSATLSASIARRLAKAMLPQEQFNTEYFAALVDYITLGDGGQETIHTKTETEVSM